jgi:hypothetical protein
MAFFNFHRSLHSLQKVKKLKINTIKKTIVVYSNIIPMSFLKNVFDPIFGDSHDSDLTPGFVKATDLPEDYTTWLKEVACLARPATDSFHACLILPKSSKERVLCAFSSWNQF